MLLVGDDVV